MIFLLVFLVFAAGVVGGIVGALLLRGRAIDAEMRIAHVLSTSAEWLPGFDIGERAHVPAGTVYAVLPKFEQLGMVETRWADPRHPRRRLYRWTAKQLPA